MNYTLPPFWNLLRMALTAPHNKTPRGMQCCQIGLQMPAEGRKTSVDQEFIALRNSALSFVPFILPSKNSIASTVFSCVSNFRRT